MSQPQAAIPTQPRAKQLRACLLCSIVQTPADFRKHGCPNCEEIMQVRASVLQSFRIFISPPQMKGYPDRISVCTTTHFEGMVGMVDPEHSWVARWQRTCVYLASLLVDLTLTPL